jgi:hypothetical protein
MNQFAKTTRDGRAVTITPDERGMFVTAAVAGKVVYSGALGRVPLSADVPAGYTMSAGPVLLTDAEHEQVRALLREAAAAWALTPDGVAARYEALCLAVDAASGAAADNRAEAFDAGRLAGYFASGAAAADDAAVAAAERELAGFHAAHPEVRAALADLHDANVLRWMSR